MGQEKWLMPISHVGGAPGKINLYVGKTPIKFNI
jgi:hypothetical protein